MRRGPGLSGLQRKAEIAQRYEKLGNEIEAASTAAMQQQLQLFQTNLQEFAAKHKKSINQNPAFRAQFQAMCAAIGVDPLATNKGLWAQALGFGDFFYELAVQVIEVCVRTRPQNGGLIDLDELLRLLRLHRRGRHAVAANSHAAAASSHAAVDAPGDVTREDVRTALQKASVLGNGYRTAQLGGREVVVSVPVELLTDHSALLALAARSGGRVTFAAAQAELGWPAARVRHSLDMLLQEGMCWVDQQERVAGSAGPEEEAAALEPNQRWSYWIPALWQARAGAGAATSTGGGARGAGEEQAAASSGPRSSTGADAPICT